MDLDRLSGSKRKGVEKHNADLYRLRELIEDTIDLSGFMNDLPIQPGQSIMPFVGNEIWERLDRLNMQSRGDITEMQNLTLFLDSFPYTSKQLLKKIIIGCVVEAANIVLNTIVRHTIQEVIEGDPNLEISNSNFDRTEQIAQRLTYVSEGWISAQKVVHIIGYKDVKHRIHEGEFPLVDMIDYPSPVMHLFPIINTWPSVTGQELIQVYAALDNDLKGMKWSQFVSSVTTMAYSRWILHHRLVSRGSMQLEEYLRTQQVFDLKLALHDFVTMTAGERAMIEREIKSQERTVKEHHERSLLRNDVNYKIQWVEVCVRHKLARYDEQEAGYVWTGTLVQLKWVKETYLRDHPYSKIGEFFPYHEKSNKKMHPINIPSLRKSVLRDCLDREIKKELERNFSPENLNQE